MKKVLTITILVLLTVGLFVSCNEDAVGSIFKDKIQQYTVTFNTNGGSEVQSQEVLSGNKVNKPADPTKGGYTFDSWYKEDTCTTAWNFSTDTVTADTTLYAKWTANPPAPVSVTSVSLDKLEVTITVGDPDVKLTATVAPDNATDKSVTWTSSDESVATVDDEGDVHAVAAGEATITVTTVDGNKTNTCAVEVVAPAPETYTVTFNLNGITGTAPDAQTISSGEKATKPTDPTKDGYTFDGWYKEGTCTTAWNFSTDTVTADTVLYAKWNCTVTFDLNGIAGTAPQAKTIKYGEKVTKPADPTDTVHTFAGWYKTKDATTGALSDPWNFDTHTVTADMTLYAKWTRTLESILEANPDIPKSDNESFSDDAWINTSKANYKAGIITKDSRIGFSIGNKQEKRLTYYTDEVLIEAGSSYVLDYESLGYGILTFHMTNSKLTSVEYDGKGSSKGYDAINGTYKAPTTSISTITLNPNGGTGGSTTATVAKGATSTSLITAPTKDGYTLEGWYTAATGGYGVLSPDGSQLFGVESYTAPDDPPTWDRTDSVTLYAHWTAKEYTITYKDLGDNTFSGTHGESYPTSHTYGTATTLVSPTKTGYTFDGWFTTSNCSGTAIISLGATEYTSDITLYANWTDSNLIKGIFSVSSTKKVQFTKGNLQATYDSDSSAYTFGFAEHQYDYIGSTSGNTTIASQTNGAVVDLFLWSTTENMYGVADTTGSLPKSFKDWGEHFKDAQGNMKYRTPSKDELNYLLNTRTTTSTGMTENARYAKIKIGDVCGLLIFPDTFAWTLAMGTAPGNVNVQTTKWEDVPSYSFDNFKAMEDAGCVFLPIAGWRRSTGLHDLENQGHIWTSSNGSSYYSPVCSLGFYNTYISVSDGACDVGHSVRLVGDCQ